MPASYSHYSFGQTVLKKLPQSIKDIIIPNKEAYYIGLNGPDILFYYKPLFKNEINKYGHRLHDEKAYGFLERGKRYIEESKDEVCLSYILGFVCHFVLDSSCHPFIEEAMKESNISHAEIEAELDGALMRRNNLSPQRHSAGAHIIPNRVTATHIANFYNNVNGKEIYKCLKAVRLYNKLLLCQNSIKRRFIKGLLGLIKGGEGFSHMIINVESNRKCIDVNKKLLELYENAVDEAVHRVEEYYNAVKNNDNLGEFFNRNFL
ncbi:zinc dependent phospholipase C family protein [Clostridium sp.]|uniref:zinc dependent phospholipase C family protein n=1 Tax=Clostridium sp. TaxID=1506 RepID=UPI003464994E